MHPTKASQQEFLATCIDIDLERNVKHAQWHKYTRKRGHQTTYFVPSGARRQICKTQFLHYFKISRIVLQSVAKVKAAAAIATPLSPMKRPFCTDSKKYAHTPPPKKERYFAHWTESSENLGKMPKPTELAPNQ